MIDVPRLAEAVHQAIASLTRNISTTYGERQIMINAQSPDGQQRIEVTVLLKDLWP